MKNLSISVLITWLYFGLFLYIGIGKSGGDIFVWAGTLLFSLIHFIIICILFLIKKEVSILYGVLGVVFGLLISFLFFKYVI